MKGWFCPFHGFVGEKEEDVVRHRIDMKCFFPLRRIEREELSSLLLLFTNLMKNENLDIVDYANIRDKFLYEVLDIMKSNDKERATDLVYFFEWLGGIIERLDMEKRFPDEFPLKFYYSLFYLLSQMLSLYFEIGTIEGEMIKREEFEKSFEITKSKLEVY
jgi:hypothetical protein